MSLLRIVKVSPLDGFQLRLELTDGSTIVRDAGPLLVGAIFEALRADRSLFRAARAEDGTVVWPNGADLCPDTLIWGGPPPQDSSLTPSDAQPAPSCTAAEPA